MANGIYIGISGTGKKVRKSYIGVNGVARKVKKMYVGVNGVAKLAWRSSVPAGQVIFTTSQIWTIPDGIGRIDIFCIGGGGSGSVVGEGQYVDNYGYGTIYTGTGGCSGFTTTQKNVAVSPGAQIAVTIGAGGQAMGCGCPSWSGGDWQGKIQYNNGVKGGTTSFGTIVSAQGGDGGIYYNYFNTPHGGSGGGAYKGVGGSDGSNGVGSIEQPNPPAGIGQQTTTKYFGETNSTLYAGGGGGTGVVIGTKGETSLTNGGAGGGGYGKYGNNGHAQITVVAEGGTSNTGSGGGGAKVSSAGNYNSSAISGQGGSGLVIVRWIEQ